MSGTDNNRQKQKLKTSKLAVASVSLGILGLLILGFKVVIVLYPYRLNVLLWNIMGLLGLIGLILGAVAFERIKRSKWNLKGSALAILGIVFAASISHLWLVERAHPRSRAMRIPCGSNLMNLGKAMLIYANDNRQYPQPNQWCDLLLKHGEVDIENFVCPSIELVLRWPLRSGKLLSWPSPKRGRCHFAMNPNCKPNSPSDTVLLFETKEGWNQFGGPELLTTQRHDGDGCNVLYNDSHVNFEKSIAELNWGKAQLREESKNKIKKQD
jgi:hypothetical protein